MLPEAKMIYYLASSACSTYRTEYIDIVSDAYSLYSVHVNRHFAGEE